MASGRPITTITLGGRQVAVRRVALRPEEVGRVVGETEGQIIMRLRCRDLAGVLGSADWLVRVEGAAALANAKVRDGLLDEDALATLAALIEGGSARRRR
jgi:hypothetical protein